MEKNLSRFSLSIGARLALTVLLCFAVFSIGFFRGSTLLKDEGNALIDTAQKVREIGNNLNQIGDLHFKEAELINNLFKNDELKEDEQYARLTRKKISQSETRFKALIVKIKNNITDANKNLKDTKATQYFSHLSEKIDTVVESRSDFYDSVKTMIKHLERGNREEASQIESSLNTKVEITKVYDLMHEHSKTQLDHMVEGLKVRAENASNEYFYFSIFAGLIVSLFVFLTYLKIITPIRKTIRIANRISKGEREITFPKNISGSDEPSTLLRAMKGMLKSIHEGEDLIESEQEYFEAVLESTPIPLIVLDEEKKIDFVNTSFLSQFKLKSETIESDLFLNENSQWYFPSIIHKIDELEKLEKGSKKTFEFEFTRDFKELGRRTLVINVKKLKRSFFGEVKSVVILNVNDITDQKHFEKELEEARQSALRASNAKSAFLANMSHEIRTPLNAIVAMGDLLNETKLDEKQEQYLATHNRASKTLLDLLNDILDLSKIESHSLELDHMDFDLIESTKSACEILKIKAEQKGLKFLLDVDEQVPQYVFGDPLRLKQILLNLVGNAVKFTEKGKVSVLCYVELGLNNDGKTSITFEVNDTGVGIAKESIQSIFDNFKQADSSVTRKHGGTGLGLAISQRLANLMNSEIIVQSEMGVGTQFKLTIPFEVSKAPRKNKTERLKLDLQQAPVLLIDDNLTNLEILEELFLSWNAIVDKAAGVKEAKKIVESKNNAHSLIISDYRMSDSTGIEFAKWISDTFKNQKPKIVLLSSEVIEDSEELIKSNIFNAVLTKPIRKNVLKHKVNELFLDREKNNAQSESTVSHKKILVAEDMKDNQDVISAYLENSPYHVTFANHGNEAVQFFKKNNFDLIMMDIEMPIKDGIAAMTEIKKLEKTLKRKPIPIAALTAYAFVSDRKRFLSLGFDFVLTKPIAKQRLLEFLRESVGYSRFQEDAILVKPSEEGVDLDSLDESIRKLVPQYVKNRKNDLMLISEAIQSKNFEKIRSIGHQIKGSSEMYGFKSLKGIGSRLEVGAKEKNIKAIEQAYIKCEEILKNHDLER